MRVRVASVGKDRSKLFAAGVDEYSGRLAHYCRFALLELRASARQGELARQEEGRSFLEKLGPRDTLWALDERGEQLGSTELAARLEKARSSGKDLLVAIGGDEGLSEQVRTQASLVLGLSRLTLPHRLARLLFLEQLYRAFTVLKGEPYHK